MLAGIESMDVDDPVLRLLPGDAPLLVGEMSAVLEPHSGGFNGGPVRGSADPRRRRLDGLVEPRRQPHQRNRQQLHQQP